MSDNERYITLRSGPSKGRRILRSSPRGQRIVQQRRMRNRSNSRSKSPLRQLPDESLFLRSRRKEIVGNTSSESDLDVSMKQSPTHQLKQTKLEKRRNRPFVLQGRSTSPLRSYPDASLFGRVSYPVSPDVLQERKSRLSHIDLPRERSPVVRERLLSTDTYDLLRNQVDIASRYSRYPIIQEEDDWSD